jgi:hypothetical protein
VEEELNITPELTRELLLSALKLLEKEKTSHVATQKPLKVVRVLQQPQPCSNMVLSSEEPEAVKTDEPEVPEDGSNSRRSILTTKTAIARDPYTGINRLVTVPVIYPTYRIHPVVYG